MSPSDPHPSTEALLSHAQWMSALARRLVADPQLAEDAVQDSWIAALRAPGASARASRSWLERILRNSVLQRIRSEAARRNRERSVARSEALDSAADVIERAHAQRRLVECVLALDEPYRSTILLRYFDGLTAEEIARLQAIPSSTVRTRLSRAIAALREKLEREGGATWMSALLPLAKFGAPGGGLGAPLPGSLGGSTAAAVSSALLGGIAMHTGIKIAGGVAAAGLVAWLCWPDGTKSVSPDPAQVAVTTTPTATLMPSGETEAPGLSTPAESQRAPATVPARTTDPFASLLVRATWGEDGTPAEGVHLFAMTWGAPDSFRARRQAAIGADGSARLERLHPGAVTVYSDRGGSVRGELRAGEESEVALVIEPGFSVDGRVEDSAGNPVPGAVIWLSEYGNEFHGLDVTTSGPGGRFFLRSVGSSRHVAARARGFAPSRSHSLEGNVGRTVSITLVLPGEGGELAGLIRDPDGAAVIGAEVVIGPETLAPGPPPMHLWTDDTGRFRSLGVAPGLTPVRVRAPGLAPWSGSTEVSANTTSQLVIDLLSGAAIRGIVRDAQDRVARGVFVGVGPYGDFTSSQTRTADDGTFRLEGLAPGEIEVRARSEKLGRATTRIVVTVESEAFWEARLERGGSVAGRVVDEHGQPLEHWMVGAVARDHTGLYYSLSRTDVNGGFRLENWPPQGEWIAVREPDRWIGDAAVVVSEFEMGDEDIVIHVSRDARATAFLEGLLVGPDSSPAKDARLAVRSTESFQGWDHALDADTGRFRIGPLRAGRYRIGFNAPGLVRLDLPERAVSADERTDLGTLVLEQGGSIRVRVAWKDGGEIPKGLQCTLANVRGEARWGVEFEGGEGTRGSLPPNTYVVRVRGPEARGGDQEVNVRAGEESLVEILLEPATYRRLKVLFPEDASKANELRVLARDSQGRIAVDLRLQIQGREQREFGPPVFGLALGDYEVEVSTDTGLFATTTFAVLELEPDPIPILLNLR